MRNTRLALLGGVASAVLLATAAQAQSPALTADVAAAPAAAAVQSREQLAPLPDVDIPFTGTTWARRMSPRAGPASPTCSST
jgi:hypothetical protein